MIAAVRPLNPSLPTSQVHEVFTNALAGPLVRNDEPPRVGHEMSAAHLGVFGC